MTLGGEAGNASAVAAESNGRLFLVTFEDTPSGAGTPGIFGIIYDYVFSDGFELGNTSVWSDTVP
jgi:hypothetical protein